MPANCHADCSATGGGATGWGAGAISVTVQPPDVTQGSVIFNDPGRRAVRAARAISHGETAGTQFAEGHAAAGYGKWGGFEDNTPCV